MFGVSVFMKEELTSTDARKDARLWVGCMHGSQLAFDVSRAFCIRATDGHASSCSSGASATTPSILSAASRSLPNRLSFRCGMIPVHDMLDSPPLIARLSDTLQLSPPVIVVTVAECTSS